MMKMPWNPEPVEKLRERYPKALEELIDTESVHLGSVLPATQRPQNIFQFENGIHLVVSRQTLMGDEFHHTDNDQKTGVRLKEALLITVSLKEDSPLQNHLREMIRTRLADPVTQLIQEGEKAYRSISGDTDPIEYMGTRNMKVLIWIKILK